MNNSTERTANPNVKRLLTIFLPRIQPYIEAEIRGTGEPIPAMPSNNSGTITFNRPTEHTR